MLNHQTKHISKVDPLNYFLLKEYLIGRMTKWVMILTEFDIEYVNKGSTKRQVVSNQLENATLIDTHHLIVYFPNDSSFMVHDTPLQKLYVDGSYTYYNPRSSIYFLFHKVTSYQGISSQHSHAPITWKTMRP